LQGNANSIIALNNRAIALRRTGDLEEALETIKRALNLNLAYAKGWANRAAIEQLEWSEEAIVSAEKSISLDDTLGGPYTTKAFALMQLGHRDDALDCLKIGQQKCPNDKRFQQALLQLA
jgi:tetratricopeptide (TPR) repeat protein